MHDWLKPALDYIPQWLEYQLRDTEQPGCVIAVAHKARIVLERAFGFAELVSRETMTPRHRFRVASHSKSFTAAGIMKLREEGRLGLDDTVGQHVPGHRSARDQQTARPVRERLDEGLGVRRLRPQVGLDDTIGQHVEGLHPAVAAATVAQLLSHSAGIVRDGTDGGQWQDQRPFLSAD